MRTHSVKNRITTITDSKYGELVQPILVSVDPWRDSVEQVKTYVKGSLH
jgi:cytochrome oxidase Cu insertion factor (SCO1/SenC/PrrC family)